MTSEVGGATRIFFSWRAVVSLTLALISFQKRQTGRNQHELLSTLKGSKGVILVVETPFNK